jgi:hypothetical protein
LARHVLDETSMGRDYTERPIMWALVQTQGFDANLKYTGRFRKDLPAHMFLRENFVGHGSAAMKAEHAAVTKGEAAQRKRDEGTVTLATMGETVAKRTMPEVPTGHTVTRITTYSMWESAMLGMAKYFGYVRDEAEASAGQRNIREYMESMEKMWGAWKVFHGDFDLFLDMEQQIRNVLQSNGSTDWKITQDRADIQPEMQLTERRVWGAPGGGLPRGCGGQPGGPKAPGVAKKTATGATGLPTPLDKPAEGPPDTFAKCKTRGYCGFKDSKGKPYCIQALLGACKNTACAGGKGCSDEKGGQERTHACVRCKKFHTFAGAGACPAPLR